jgi:hypothetical protein
LERSRACADGDADEAEAWAQLADALADVNARANARALDL